MRFNTQLGEGSAGTLRGGESWRAEAYASFGHRRGCNTVVESDTNAFSSSRKARRAEGKAARYGETQKEIRRFHRWRARK